jgi:nucleotide-binding universal stress UspA family protein
MAGMFKTILCPVDIDRDSLAALDTARSIGERNGSMIYILHVIAPRLPGPLEPIPDWEKTVALKLENVAHQRFGDALRYQVLIRPGDPVLTVEKVADEVGADLLVMATHGHKGFNRVLLGSVTERVVRESPRPVLTVRPA